MLLADRRIRTPLTVGGEVAVFQVVAGEVLVASGVMVFFMLLYFCCCYGSCWCSSSCAGWPKLLLVH